MKKISILVVILVVLVSALSFIIPMKPVSSASVTIITVDPADTGFDPSAKPTSYCFGGVEAQLDSGDFWRIDFDDNFDLNGITVSDTAAESEIEIYIGNQTCTAAGATIRITETGTDDQTDRDLATVDTTDNIVLLYLTDAYWDGVSPGTGVSIKFIDKTDGNDYAIQNPVTAGNYFYSLGQGAQSDMLTDDILLGDLLYIGGINEVDISASVDPTLTFDIVEIASDTATTSCDLGELLDFSISTCSYRTKISTNGPNGYTLYVKEVAQLQNADGDLIGYSDGTINEGVSEYGIATTDLFTGQGIDQLDDADGNLTVETADCTYTGVPANDVTSGTFTALSSSAESFASSDVAVTDEYTTMCYGASISDATEGGVYTQDIILTVVGNF